MAQKWTPRVEKRRHPFGEEGVNHSLDQVAKKVAEGSTDWRVRRYVGECLQKAGIRKATDDQKTAKVLLKAVQQKTWMQDPVGTEWMPGAHLMTCVDKDTPCFHGGDCFVEGTLVLAEGHELTPIEKIKPGMKIWGLDRWSSVEAVQYKGNLLVDVIKLNNGSTLKLTGGHKVYVLDCKKHPMLDDSEDAKTLPADRHWRGAEGRRPGCSCKDRVEKRTRVSELREGMAMVAPERLPFGADDIHRLSTRGNVREDGRHPWLLRVKGVERDVAQLPCWDIQTDDHRVYLPEHDVTVSNCDDLSILLGACLLSAGIHTIVVGHAYNKKRQIQHVLCAARVNGKWLYADPSTDLPLGKCIDFTRERWLSVPNVKVICDQNKCSTDLSGYDPYKNNFVVEGQFIGVDGVRMNVIEWEERPTVQWLGATTNDGAAASAESAAAEEMVERDYGTSREDVQAYAAAAGSAGAMAACTAYGAGAIASTVCGPIGAALGKYLGGALYDAAEDIFSPGPSEEELKKAAEAQRAKEELQWIVGNLNPAGNLELALGALTDLYRKANEKIGMGGWPPSETALARALQSYGLPISWTTSGPTVPNFPNSELSSSQMSPHHAVAYLEAAVPWTEKLRLSVTQLSNRIIGQAGASAALVSEGKEPQPITLPVSPSEIQVSPIASRMTIQPKTTTEKTSPVKVAAATAAAGGIAWWLWTVFA